MKLKGHFLCSKNGIAWAIPGREAQRMYRERAYKPPPGWRFRRNIDYLRRDASGCYLLKGYDHERRRSKEKGAKETFTRPALPLQQV